jgi:hypothetical protein
MDNQARTWNILNWNIRGLNSDDKCNAVCSKIEESSCVIYCLQETKRQSFDSSSIKKLAPKRFNKFSYVPSQGASGGILVEWNGAHFTGQVIQMAQFAITVSFTAVANAERWNLTVVYGSCQGQERQQFVGWLNYLQILDDDNWMILGDFNFYRSPDNRNRGGGNMQDVMTFNDIINNLGLLEIPLKGRSFTWSNMHQDPLLKQLDWCFTSANWISVYPNTLLLPLARPTSDHTPCMIQVGTAIPKSLFRFESYWVDQPGFLDLIQTVWNSEVRATNSVTKITAKFKLLRRVLKRWALGLSKLKKLLQDSNTVHSIMDKLEENRTPAL